MSNSCMAARPTIYDIARSARAERGRSIAEFLSGLATAYGAWSRRRVAVRHLRELDDYLLKDIGISRSEIVYVIKNGRARR